jgi:elongation factor Tu
MITGAAQMDTAILLVSAPDGPQEQTREHLILAREVGIPNVCVFMNKMDLMEDLEMAEMVEQEIRELLTTYGYDGAKSPVVKGAALLALNETPTTQTKWGREALKQLIDTLDHVIPSPVRDLDKPFMMPIEDVFAIAGRGTVITGRIETGTLKLGQEVSIVGRKPIPKIGVTGIEMFKKQMDKAQAGDNIGALLRGIKREDVARGEIACHPGTIQCYTKFSAKIYCLDPDEGGRTKPFGSKYRPQFFLRTANVTGIITLTGNTKMAMPGDNVEVEVELISPTPVTEGQRFAMREGAVTVAAGVVTKINK